MTLKLTNHRYETYFSRHVIMKHLKDDHGYNTDLVADPYYWNMGILQMLHRECHLENARRRKAVFTKPSEGLTNEGEA